MSDVPAPSVPPYATRIPYRRPEFKAHTGIGHAKNAIIGSLNHGGRAGCAMIIYRLEDGEYQPWITVKAGQHRDDIPELAPKPRPKSHVQWEIDGLARQEQEHLKRAEDAAARRRELEATL